MKPDVDSSVLQNSKPYPWVLISTFLRAEPAGSLRLQEKVSQCGTILTKNMQLELDSHTTTDDKAGQKGNTKSPREP